MCAWFRASSFDYTYSIQDEPMHTPHGRWDNRGSFDRGEEEHQCQRRQQRQLLLSISLMAAGHDLQASRSHLVLV